MKLNNKGFAITTALYGTMVLFLMLSVASLGMLATYKTRAEKIIDTAECLAFDCESGDDTSDPEPDVGPISGDCSISVTGGTGKISTSVSSSQLASSPYGFGSTYSSSSSRSLTCSGRKECVIVATVKKVDGSVLNCGSFGVTMIEMGTANCNSVDWNYSNSFIHGSDTACPQVYASESSILNAGLSQGAISCVNATASVCIGVGYSDGQCMTVRKATGSCTGYGAPTNTYVTSCSDSISISKKVSCSGNYNVWVK